MKIDYLIKELLNPSITALPFIDRYASIVRTVKVKVPNDTDEGIEKRYPVACDVLSPDCESIYTNDVYTNLVPDDSKNSVIYWEEIQGLTNTGQQPNGKYKERIMKGKARLVAWLNLGKLGIAECNGGIEAQLLLEDIIQKKGKLQVGPFAGSNYWLQVANEVKQDPDLIFGKYDYPKDLNWYLYPNNFFAIDVNFRLDQCLATSVVFPSDPPLDCPNEIPTF